MGRRVRSGNLVPCPSVFSGLGPRLVPAGKIGAVCQILIFLHVHYAIYEKAPLPETNGSSCLSPRLMESVWLVLGVRCRDVGPVDPLYQRPRWLTHAGIPMARIF